MNMSVIEQLQSMEELLDLEKKVNRLKNTISNSFSKDLQTSIANMTACMMNIIEAYYETPEAVACGREMFKKFSELMLQKMIQPQDYEDSIHSYVSWHNSVIQGFINNIRLKSSNDDNNREKFHKIEQAWSMNEQSNEGFFFGGAARPLFPERITAFSDILSSYYKKLDPIYVQNRSILFNILHKLAREEGNKYWKNYDLFPSTTSTGVIEKCLNYFFSHDRNQTYFINSSGSDYIPFVHLAQKIFPSDKFLGSSMTNPDDHNTKSILKTLVKQCTHICKSENKSNPLFIILLTSKNRFGARIDVDKIHQKLEEKCPGKILTLVDACQDGQSFENVDIILYSKRFTINGAIALINKQLINKHTHLKKNMELGTGFPVETLAQIYMNINMINEKLAYGIEDLVDSATWTSYSSPVVHELKSAFNSYSQLENSTSMTFMRKNGLVYEFTEDELGTIVMIKFKNEDETLSRLMSTLNEQGHTLDSFVMNDRYDKSPNVVNVKKVIELINEKNLTKLREMEAKCSAHLAWPLVPFSVVKSSDDLFTTEHFDRCQSYHRCLRISIDRSVHPGKLKRFCDIVQQIIDKDEVTDAIAEDDTPCKSHLSQCPSN